jgi:hypothetical protein
MTAVRLEAARRIECGGMRIPYHMQRRATLRLSTFGAVIDQCTPDAGSPNVRLDKEAIELGLTVQPRQHNGKSDDSASKLSNENPALS